MTLADFPTQAFVQSTNCEHSAMEYTNELSLRELQALFTTGKACVRSVAKHLTTDEELVAPVTHDGKKIIFES